MSKPLALLALLAMAGCAPVPVPSSELDWPDPNLMAKIPDLPPVKRGDDLYHSNLVCRGEYGRVADKARGLQGYVNVIHKRKEQSP